MEFSLTGITKFTLASVESWKEVKDQSGCYFSRGLPALSAGVDGEPFPARCGYLKLGVKSKLDIPTCPNHIVSSSFYIIIFSHSILGI